MARRSHKIETINIQDFYDHSSLNGLVSFLDVPPKKLAEQVSTADDSPPVGKLPPVGESPTGGESPTVGELPTAPDLPSALGRRQKVRRAVDVQDGHSAGEQCLYSALWAAAKLESPETRLVTIGYRGMSILCKLERTNCKKNTGALIQKLAIEVASEHDSDTQTGHTYRVFSFKEILRRRKEAGMLWVVRTCGVRFVRPDDGAVGDLPPVGESPTVGDLPPEAVGDFGGAVGELHTGAVGESHTGAVGKTHTHTGREQENTGITTTSTGPLQDAIEAMAHRSRLKRIVTIDDEAARKLDGFRLQLEATVEETAYMLVDKLLDLQENKGLYNPLGILLDKPDTWHTPRALKKLRDRQSQ